MRKPWLFSQLLTLYTTPVVYLYLDRLQLWGTRLVRRRTQGRPAAGSQGQARRGVEVGD
jgi:multidrug efflux pump